MSIDSFENPVWESIREHLIANWTYTPIQWPNEEFSNHESVPWVKVDFDGSGYAQQTIGAETQAANRWDWEGTLRLHLAIQKGVPVGPALGAAKALADLFRGRVDLNGNLEFTEAKIASSVYGDDVGAWTVIPVSVDWRHVDA